MSMNNGGVYAIFFHTDSGDKIYVGSTIQVFKNRFNYHLCELRFGRHRNRHLQNLWNKHQEAEFRILEECPNLSEPELRSREQWWIDQFDRSVLINIGPAAPSAALGMKHTPETRAKIGAASLRRWQDPIYRAKRSASNSAAFKGKPKSKEHREALSKAHKGKPLSPVHRENMLAAMRSPEVTKKISDTLTGRKLSPEHRANISKGLKNG